MGEGGLRWRWEEVWMGLKRRWRCWLGGVASVFCRCIPLEQRGVSGFLIERWLEGKGARLPCRSKM